MHTYLLDALYSRAHLSLITDNALVQQNQRIHRTRRAPAQLSFSASSWGVGKVDWAAPNTSRLFPWSERAAEGSETSLVYRKMQILRQLTPQTYLDNMVSCCLSVFP